MELTAKQAREMRREENRRAWARRQERFDREAERHQREGAEEKRARRAANRERWWMARHGCHAPGQPPVDELPDVPAKSIERTSPDDWQVIGKDGEGYEVERSYTVTVQGERFELPSLEDAAEFVRMAVDSNREAMREQWREGASQDGYTVEKATLSGVTVRHESGARCTLAPKLDRGRAYVTLHSRSRFARRLYADEMV